MGKHDRTLTAIFEDSVRANISWKDIEAMLVFLGAELSEGRGSRLRVVLNGVRATFHRPHPEKEANKYTIRDLRDFLDEAGVKKP